MSSIQQFHQLPEYIQKEVLDFMSYIAKKNGIDLKEENEGKSDPKWLKKVHRPQNTGKPISETVRQMRDQETW